MTKGLLFFLYFFSLSFLGIAQELNISGTYQGQNLYVSNPTLENDTNKFCVKAVYVNNVKTQDVINSNAFEIDFSQINLAEDKAVDVRIIYHEGCKPTIVNPNVLQVSANFSITPPRVDRRSNLLTWSISGTLDENPFIVEQFRWEKWIQLGEVLPSDSVSANSYAYEVGFHSKQNTFRIRHIDISGVERISREGRYVSREEEITILSTRVSDWIYFSGETLYEVYDEKGIFILDGFGKDINVRDFERGRYWVNFDNRTEIVTKR